MWVKSVSNEIKITSTDKQQLKVIFTDNVILKHSLRNIRIEVTYNELMGTILKRFSRKFMSCFTVAVLVRHTAQFSKPDVNMFRHGYATASESAISCAEDWEEFKEDYKGSMLGLKIEPAADC